MRPGEVSLTCSLCDEPTERAVRSIDRVLIPYCRTHGIVVTATNPLATHEYVVRCEGQGLARLDRDRCGGDVICTDCGRKYYDHPQDLDHPYLNVLCDGSAVKL